jgi:rhodanese-related sulfurtransferase
MSGDLSHYRSLLDRGIVLIDVRTPAEFEDAHATGAFSVPLDRLDPVAVMKTLPPDTVVHLICQSGNRAATAYGRFKAAGFERAMVVPGGTRAWIACGLPVTHGRKTISLERQVRIGAGALVLTGVALGATVHPWLYGISAFVGTGLVFAGITDICAMGMILARLPWNRGRGTAACTGGKAGAPADPTRCAQ